MYRKTLSLLAVLHFMYGLSKAQPVTDTMLQRVLDTNRDSLFQAIVQNPGDYMVQIIYTRIDRDRNNIPRFKNFYFHHDRDLYFYPASTVKMPLAFLSLEKLNALRSTGINKFTTVLFDSSQHWQTSLYRDSSAANNLPTMAHFIKRALLISENDPYNRMYQFLGQGHINQTLHRMGYKDTRITRQFLGLTEEQNRNTNALRFLDSKGKVLYDQPPKINIDSFDFSKEVLVGEAYLDRKDSLVREPFDFTRHNAVPLESLQQMLQSVLFPRSVPLRQRFNLTRDDYEFLYRYLSQYPSETPDPKYDTAEFYDSYVKFFFSDSTRTMPQGVRVFNKVGWAYGYLTDVAYVADFKNKVEFMLSATVYANQDGILNDNKYEYLHAGQPFLFQLGQTIYRYELDRPRKNLPDLSDFNIHYEERSKSDSRPSLKQVDN